MLNNKKALTKGSPLWHELKLLLLINYQSVAFCNSSSKQTKKECLPLYSKDMAFQVLSLSSDLTVWSSWQLNRDLRALGLAD